MSTQETTSCLRGTAGQVWNYECFDSPKKERVTMIALFVISAVCLLIAIFTKSPGLGTLSTISGLAGAILLIRRLLKIREENHVPLDNRITISELSHVFLETKSSEQESQIKAPQVLVEVFKDVSPFRHTKKLENIDPMSKIFQRELSLAIKNTPHMCHGTFKNGQGFILVKFRQATANEPLVGVDNFILFTGPQDGDWKVYDYDDSLLSSKWNFKFDFSRKDDIERLKRLVRDGATDLRRGWFHGNFTANMKSTKKET